MAIPNVSKLNKIERVVKSGHCQIYNYSFYFKELKQERFEDLILYTIDHNIQMYELMEILAAEFKGEVIHVDFRTKKVVK